MKFLYLHVKNILVLRDLGKTKQNRTNKQTTTNFNDIETYNKYNFNIFTFKLRMEKNRMK